MVSIYSIMTWHNMMPIDQRGGILPQQSEYSPYSSEA